MNLYAKKKALVTGGLGFIGSNLASRLVESGAKVTIVDCCGKECGLADYLNPSTGHPQCRLRRPAACDSVLPARATMVAS